MIEPWLLMATTGKKSFSASSFGRTTLLDTLRDKISEACDGILDEEDFGGEDNGEDEPHGDGDKPHGGGEDNDADENDPMDMVDAEVTRTPGKGKRKDLPKKRFLTVEIANVMPKTRRRQKLSTPKYPN